MIYYILQVIVFQALFLIVYELFLKKETFFNNNRAYLLLSSVMALIIPFIKLKPFQKVITSDYLIHLPEVVLGVKTPKENIGGVSEFTLSQSENYSFNWEMLVFIGASISFLVFIYRLNKIYKTTRCNTTLTKGQYRLVLLKNTNTAYSFFNYIFLGELISDEEKESILTHEKVHVNEKHSMDLMWFEVLKIVFWFNPLVYLYQNKIKEVHEYIADEKSLKVNQSAYKSVLLNQLFQSKSVSFVNPFYKKSLIKNRLIMLGKSKSNQKQALKYFLILPLVSIMLTYSNLTIAQEKSSQKAEVTKSMKDPYSISEVDSTPMFSSCINVSKTQERQCFSTELGKIINKNFNLDLANQLNIKGKVRIVSNFIIDKKGEVTNIKVKTDYKEFVMETERILKLIPKLKPALKDNKPVSVTYALPIEFIIKE